MNYIQKELEQLKVDREVDEHNESHEFRLGYVKAMCHAINLVKNLDIQRVMRCASCEHKIDLTKAEKMQRYDELEHRYIKVLHCDRCGHGHDNWKVE
jgi:hypothetical protein